MASIHEVAKRAGVSTATVSRALTRPDLVSTDTRRSIAQPMRQIGEMTVRMLVDILSGRTIASVSVTLPHTLVVRSSTARARG